MIRLSVNLNKVALIRNSRSGNFPDILRFAKRSIAAGAHGITVHPRPDQRHIRATDIAILKAFIDDHPNVELNIEGNPFSFPEQNQPGFLELVHTCLPDQCTLVPDTTHQLTSDHGFDLRQPPVGLRDTISTLRALGIRVSLFLDADSEQVRRAADIGADRIELYTGPYAWSHAQNPNSEQTRILLTQHHEAAELAHRLGLGVNAGHDLNLGNLVAYRNVPHLAEVSIGHAFTVDALERGWDTAVDDYLRILNVHDQA